MPTPYLMGIYLLFILESGVCSPADLESPNLWNNQLLISFALKLQNNCFNLYRYNNKKRIGTRTRKISNRTTDNSLSIVVSLYNREATVTKLQKRKQGMGQYCNIQYMDY